MAGQLDEAAKQILATLLGDFNERGLGFKELEEGYEGPTLAALATAVCVSEDITQVDFEVAFSDLEKARLVDTGPYENHSSVSSSLVFIGGFKQREYAYLTQNGYKESRKAPNRPQQRVQKVINTVNIHGGSFTNLQLAAGENAEQSMTVQSGTDNDIVNQLLSILAQQGMPISEVEKEGIQSAVDAANEGDGKQAKSILTKVCGPLWESVQPVMWPIVGELIKKSLGL
ncbi:hypothetical protein [Citrobacter portucalensis]|uniref:hypothetical protein n=1 Tax=Citrobacter portucalensis TaxID=1639133 RepID=UPI00295DA048|nr:hypothetical protein [Citrobacter pasteurii]